MLRSAVDGSNIVAGFINARLLANLDPLAGQYAVYVKAGQKESLQRILANVSTAMEPLCRRQPEIHVAVLSRTYSPKRVTGQPTGTEFGAGLEGQVAHLGLFIPFPHYRQDYENVLNETKIMTREENPRGYIGEDILVEADEVQPNLQTPYSPKHQAA